MKKVRFVFATCALAIAAAGTFAAPTTVLSAWFETKESPPGGGPLQTVCKTGNVAAQCIQTTGTENQRCLVTETSLVSRVAYQSTSTACTVAIYRHDVNP
jgi:hypothetical protein